MTALSLAAMALSFLLSMVWGASEVGWRELLQTLFNSRAPGQDAHLAETILYAIRLPRALAAALCGAALAAAGTVCQGLFRNSLASPSILGTEAGGSFAGVAAFYLGYAHLHWLTVPAAAFVGALAATLALYRFAGRSMSTPLESLLLAGFALNVLFSSLTSLIISFSLDDYAKAGAVLHWLLGGFSAKGWEHVRMGVMPIVLGSLALYHLAPRLDVLTLGEEVATSLSIDMRQLRRVAIVAMALLVGTAVAVGGALPFVGLIVPHVTRRLAGPAHRRLLLLSMVNGVTLVLLADLAARTLRAPAELEVGVLTSLLGAPFFLALLWRRRGWNA